MKNRSLMYITKVGILSALATVLMLFEFPLPFIAPPFYKLDFSELPVLIGSFALGPVAGILIELFKNLLNLLFEGTATAFVGEFANFLMGCAFVLPAAIFYRAKKTRPAALYGMICGTLTLTVVGTLINYFLLIPMYSVLYNLPIDAIVGMGQAINPAITNLPLLVVLAVAPFNLLKGAVISALTFVIYKRVSPLLKI